jgi:hypothetical protein
MNITQATAKLVVNYALVAVHFHITSDSTSTSTIKATIPIKVPIIAKISHPKSMTFLDLGKNLWYI